MLWQMCLSMTNTLAYLSFNQVGGTNSLQTSASNKRSSLELSIVIWTKNHKTWAKVSVSDKHSSLLPESVKSGKEKRLGLSMKNTLAYNSKV